MRTSTRSRPQTRSGKDLREGAVLLLLRSLHGKIKRHVRHRLGNAASSRRAGLGVEKPTLAAVVFCKEQGASSLWLTMLLRSSTTRGCPP